MKCPNCNEEIEDRDICPNCKYEIKDEERVMEKKNIGGELKSQFKVEIKETKGFLKENCLIIEVILLVFAITMFGLMIFMNIQKSGLETEILNSQKDYKNLSSKYSSIEKQLEESKDELEKCKGQIQELQQEEKQNEINNNIKALEDRVAELTTQKQDLENQINTLSQEVIRIKGEAKTYPAGYLTAGEDVPTGKYKIYGGSSNFVVYSASGSLQVNIILGSGQYKVSEYIYTFKSGDVIKANSSFKLVEVE